jgi:hypothetical protein
MNIPRHVCYAYIVKIIPYFLHLRCNEGNIALKTASYAIRILMPRVLEMQDFSLFSNLNAVWY